jgi:hypothetical protein
MSSYYQIFRKSAGGFSWFVTCGVFAGVICLGRSANLLTEACVALIAGYAIMFGVLPFLAGKRELDDAVDKSAVEHDDLTAAPSNQTEKLLALDDSAGGSVHVITKTLALSNGRGSKEAVTESVLECFDEHWGAKIADLNDVAVYCQSLGIGGTMLGLADIAHVLEANAGNAGVGSAIAVMVLTTLAGLAGFILVSGLARRLAKAVAAHRKDLKYVAVMFQRESDQPKPRKRSDNVFSGPGAA